MVAVVMTASARPRSGRKLLKNPGERMCGTGDTLVGIPQG